MFEPLKKKNQGKALEEHRRITAVLARGVRLVTEQGWLCLAALSRWRLSLRKLQDAGDSHSVWPVSLH